MLVDLSDFDNLPSHLKNSLLTRVLRELQNVADNPRLLVLIAHGFIELLVNTLIDEKCKNSKKLSNHRDFPHSAKLVILHELGAISDFRYKSLDWFRTLRNRAAHEPLFEVSEKDIANQFNQATAAQRDSDTASVRFSAQGMHQLSLLLIVTLWADHSAVFSPVFIHAEGSESATCQ